MSEWILTQETDQTWCEHCKSIHPPVYELVYLRNPSAARQYHYVCQRCAIGIGGQDVFTSGLEAIQKREAIYKDNLEAARRKRGALLHGDVLEHAGGR